MNTVLTGNGSLYSSLVGLPSGAATIRLNGGNLAAPISSSTTLTNGIPAANANLLYWIAYPKSGSFVSSVKNPATPIGSRASGIYLQKTNTVWGYFPGSTVGGRMEISIP